MSDELQPAVEKPRTGAERLVQLLRTRALWLVAILVAGALGLGFFARNIQIDNSLEVWFVDGDPALKAYDDYKAQFGNDETIIVAVVDDRGIYRPETLERIRAASRKMEQHPRVRRVTSVALGLHVSGEDGFVQVEKLLGDGPITEAEAAEVKKRVAMNPVFLGTVAPADGSDKVTLILVDPKSSDDYERQRGPIIADMRKIADAELSKGSELGVHFGGIGVIYEGLNQASLRDTSLFTTLSYLVIFAGLWLLFRRWVWVLVGAAVVTVANLATLGLAGIAGRDMNMVTAVLPTLLMTIGILDLVHLIDAYEQGKASKPELPRRRLLLGSLGVVVVPCLVNSVTDAIGFLALSSAKMSAIRDLGWLAAAGLGFLVLSVLVIGVPAIARFGGRAPNKPRATAGWIAALVGTCYRIARDRRPLVLVVTVLLIGGSAFGISRLVVDTYTLGFLAEDDPVRRDHHAIEGSFGPFIPLELTVDAPPPPPSTGEDDLYAGVKDPELLGSIDRMERAFEAHPEVARATGLPEVVKRVNQIWNDEKPEAYAVPGKAGIVAEELLNYGFEADGRDHLEDLATPDWQRTRVTARSGLPSAKTLEGTVAELTAIGEKTLGERGDVAAAGYLPLYVRITRHITDAQVKSFAIALVLVTLVLMVMLRSIRLGLVAMVLNLLPAAMTLGFMGLTGIRLDVATVLIAAIAIGISVNDTSHLMFRFRHELRTGATRAEAVERMLHHAGRPVVASSVILMAGFSVLLLASVKSVAYFGLLSAATIMSALIADLIITPALLLGGQAPRSETTET